MATFFGRGVLQGIQVCPGVYLSTAHANLDDPRDANCTVPLNKKKKCKRRKLRSPSQHFGGGSPYPVSEKTYWGLNSQFSVKQFVSPRLLDAREWQKIDTDYLFFKAKKVFRPNDYIQPLNLKAVELYDAQRAYNFKTFLYRGKSRFNLTENGVPDFNFDTRENRWEKLQKIYEKPQKVVSPCKLALTKVRGGDKYRPNSIVTDCPIEASVSGSAMISIINGKPYLVGNVIKTFKGEIKNSKRAGKDISG